MKRTPASPTPARELVCAAQRGDAEAFGLLYQRYRHRVLGYLVVLLRDHAAAEDLTSETFLRALSALSSYRDTGRDVSAWLMTIARNIASDTRSSARHRRELLTDVLPERATGHRGPEDQVIAKAEFDRVRRTVEMLTADQRRCIELRFLDQLSTLEAARRLNRNPGAVRTLQSRALRRLACLCAAEPEFADQPKGVAA